MASDYEEVLSKWVGPNDEFHVTVEKRCLNNWASARHYSVAVYFDDYIGNDEDVVIPSVEKLRESVKEILHTAKHVGETFSIDVGLGSKIFERRNKKVAEGSAPGIRSISISCECVRPTYRGQKLLFPGVNNVYCNDVCVNTSNIDCIIQVFPDVTLIRFDQAKTLNVLGGYSRNMKVMRLRDGVYVSMEKLDTVSSGRRDYGLEFPIYAPSYGFTDAMTLTVKTALLYLSVMRPELYDADALKRHEEYLKKTAGAIIFDLVLHKRNLDFVTKFFADGRKLRVSDYEVLLENINRDTDTELYATVMDSFHKNIDMEKVKQTRETKARNLIADPYKAANLKDEWGWMTWSDKGVIITEHKQKGENAAYGIVKIPPRIGNKKVLAIQKDAFTADNKWGSCGEELIVPDTVDTLCQYAFHLARYQKVMLPDTISELPEYAFSESSVQTVNIPRSVKRLGAGCFRGTQVEEVVIPDGVEELPGECFKNTPLRKIKLPASLKKIGYAAFEGCHQLTSITIPDSVESIGYDAFSGSGIQEFVFPPKITKIESGVFRNSYSYDDRGSKKLLGPRKVVMPNGVRTIERNAFAGCTALAECQIPDSVTYIGEKAFGHTGFERVETKAGYIENGAFESCHNLKTAVLPALTVMNDNLFADCRGLRTIEAPNVNVISGESLKRCLAVETMTVGVLVFVGQLKYYEDNTLARLSRVVISCEGRTNVDKERVISVLRDRNEKLFDGINITFV